MYKSYEKKARFISDAVEGKYPEFGESAVMHEVAAAMKRLSGFDNLDELLNACREIHTAEDDVNNQVVALVAIERFSGELPFKQTPLAFLHHIVYATKFGTLSRKGTGVADYPGEVPTAVGEAATRFKELEAVVVALAISPVHEVAVAAPLLAYVFAATIRIHAYEDGNGRLARFAVQFLLAKWGKPLLPLPKVRNDPVWKEALSRAVDGDIEVLAAEFGRRMQNNWGPKWQKLTH